MTMLFKELAGSPTETYAWDGMTVQRRLLCAYEDRLKAVGVLLGRGDTFGGQPPAPVRPVRARWPLRCPSSRSRRGPTTRASSTT